MGRKPMAEIDAQGVIRVSAFECARCMLWYKLHEQAAKCCRCPACKRKLEKNIYNGSGCCVKCTAKINLKRARQELVRLKRDVRSFNRTVKVHLKELRR